MREEDAGEGGMGEGLVSAVSLSRESLLGEWCHDGLRKIGPRAKTPCHLSKTTGGKRIPDL